MRVLRYSALFLLLAVPTLRAEVTSHAAAALVLETDAASIVQPLRDALASASPLTRAAAARVIAVRGIAELAPALRETIVAESDGAAAREELVALTMTGTEEDVAFAFSNASRYPAGIDSALSLAVARRGNAGALDTFIRSIARSRSRSHAHFFRTLLWGNSTLLGLTASRILGAGDPVAWDGLLDALFDSAIALPAAMQLAALESTADDVRAATVWYLVRGFAKDPSALDERVRTVAAKERPPSSDREDFGWELLRRMSGGERKDDERWLRFLGTTDADEVLSLADVGALPFLTDEEYAVRFARCEVQAKECALPKDRKRFTIPSRPVIAPAFFLPSALPAGLADAVLTATRCADDQWIGVVQVTVDRAGRVQTADLAGMQASASCRRAAETLMRLSFAESSSIRSPKSGPVLLVKAKRTPLCIDADAPESAETSTFRAGGRVEAPNVIRRTDPTFPASVRGAMGMSQSVKITVESVIAKSGCVRNLRLLEQSPFGDLNGAALLALAQWRFAPGRLEGVPVDTIFNLTINYSTIR